jgi:hypothetical protein
LLAAEGFVAAAVSFTRGQRIPAVWLYVTLCSILPLLIIGYARSYPAPRYLVTILPAILVAAFYTGQRLADWLTARVSAGHTRALRGVAVLGVLIAVINPLALGHVVDPGYDVYPDHDGAAAYVRAQQPRPSDIIVAEDVLVQTYYLDRIDYWLIQASVGQTFCRSVSGEWRDIYTNTRLLGRGEELQRLIDDPERGNLYILGSGELQFDGRLGQRGEEIQTILERQDSRVVYRGRDNGLTRVWKIPPRP